jgi:Domain of unknown function (DUF4410)
MRLPWRWQLTGTGLCALALLLAACGSTRSSADNPLSAGGLTPNVRDKDAGLVGIGAGFDVRDYPAIVVALFPVTDRLEDEGDRAFAAKMAAFFQTELVRRLRDGGLFQRVEAVKDSGDQGSTGERVLRLEGAITRLGRGSQAARYFAGIYGAGRTRAQADMRLIEQRSGKVVLVTADRRVASIGLFGGADEDHLRESFDDMARDLARFLARLSRGEAPRDE